MADVKDFIKKVSSDPELLKQMQALGDGVELKKLSEEEYKAFLEKKIIPFAKELGFDLTVDDILNEKEEMSEDDLKSVAGGALNCGLDLETILFLIQHHPDDENCGWISDSEDRHYYCDHDDPW